MTRGDIWWANLPLPWRRRPVVLLSRDEAYSLLTSVIVAPLTTSIRGIPTAVPLTPSEDGVPRRCVVNLDNIQLARVEWLSSFLVHLRPEKMEAVDRAIHFALGLRH